MIGEFKDTFICRMGIIVIDMGQLTHEASDLFIFIQVWERKVQPRNYNICELRISCLPFIWISDCNTNFPILIAIFIQFFRR